ncbi:hypothetical protein A3860_33790 [Niastella vici]|uniref:Zinc finger CHC2-type domain-containing protein n=2 Tax=Niastella vici TaxID=1703345 RepID=A0A1V9FPR6_9BACT|nr:hypothetical protein A3860_33790 [Niastella vici]
MNAEQAKTISLFEILDKLGFKPGRKTQKDAYYHYPEKKKGKKPNLHVNLKDNVWYDYRLKKGGTIIDFAMAHLEHNSRPHTVSDALAFIESTMGKVSAYSITVSTEPTQSQPRYSISNTKKIEDPALIGEVEAKGISLKLAQKYMQEVNIYDREKKSHFIAFSFPNDDDGYLVENKYFREYLESQPWVSFIRGEITGQPYIHVFKDRWDYFSLLEHQKVSVLKSDALILNDYSCLPQCNGYFYKYGYRVAFTYMPNTPDGQNAKQALTEIFRREVNLIHRPMNSMYPSPHETLNAWWQNRNASPG